MKYFPDRVLMSVVALLCSVPLFATAASSADPIVSKWNWGGASVAQIWANGRAHWQFGTMTMEGHWALVSRGGSSRERKYDITWNGGQWIDSVTMSPDHQHLYGRNQVGFPVNGIRIGGESAPEAESTTAGTETQPARRKTVIGKTKSTESSAGENGEAPGSTSSEKENASTGSGLPAKAVVVSPPEETNPDFGNIKVIFSDGHNETWTSGGMCAAPHVSSAGDVGWSRPDQRTGDRYRRNADLLHLHMHDGSTKEFKPNNLFILNWAFTNRNSEVVIESMAHHGASCYIKYDIVTGRETGRVDGYLEDSKMPKWTKAVGP